MLEASRPGIRWATQATAGRLLIVAGVLYMPFYGARFTGVDLPEVPWLFQLGLHGLLILMGVAGLALVGRQFSDSGWPWALWYVGVALAFAGLSIGHPFWSAAMLVLSVVMVVVHRQWATALLMTAGGSLWLYLFLAGLRIGDENSREIQGAEPAIALVAVLLMGAGLIEIGRFMSRHPQVSGPVHGLGADPSR